MGGAAVIEAAAVAGRVLCGSAGRRQRPAQRRAEAGPCAPTRPGAQRAERASTGTAAGGRAAAAAETTRRCGGGPVAVAVAGRRWWR